MAGIARIASGTPWEPIFGYTRAVKAGGWLAVSGTTSFDEKGLIVGRNQMYVQARQINLEVPWEIAGMASNEIQVVYNGVATNTAPVTVQAAVPGVFYLTYGSMQAAISEL